MDRRAAQHQPHQQRDDEHVHAGRRAGAGSGRPAAGRPTPPRPRPPATSGPRNWPHRSLKQATQLAHVVAAVTTASGRSRGGRRPTGSSSGALGDGPDLAPGFRPHRAAWALVRPRSCQTRSSRSRGRKVTARHPCRTSSGRAECGTVLRPAPLVGAQAEHVEGEAEGGAGVVVHPPQHRPVGLGDGADHGEQQTAVGGLGQPAGVDPGVGHRLHDGQGLEHRAGVQLGVARVPGRAEVVTGRRHQADGEAALAEVGRMEAAADTAASSEDAMPVPGGPTSGCRRRGSPATARAAPRAAPSARPPGPSCASGTCCRSSPRRYSRTVTSSALPIAKARGRLSPDPVQAPPSGIGGRGTTRGVTVSDAVLRNHRPSSTRPNGSLTRTLIGPIS